MPPCECDVPHDELASNHRLTCPVFVAFLLPHLDLKDVLSVRTFLRQEPTGRGMLLAPYQLFWFVTDMDALTSFEPERITPRPMDVIAAF